MYVYWSAQNVHTHCTGSKRPDYDLICIAEGAFGLKTKKNWHDIEKIRKKGIRLERASVRGCLLQMLLMLFRCHREAAVLQLEMFEYSFQFCWCFLNCSETWFMLGWLTAKKECKSIFACCLMNMETEWTVAVCVQYTIIPFRCYAMSC